MMHSHTTHTPINFKQSIAHTSTLSRIGVIAIICLLTTGCPPAKPPRPATNSTTVTPKSKASSSLCVESFNRIVGIVQPDRLGIDGDPKNAIVLLNEWLLTCAPKTKIALDQAPLKDQFLQDEFWADAINRLDQSQYDLKDVRHMRDAYLFRRIGSKLALQSETDLKRINGFFDYVCTNISLDPNLMQTTPHTAYESLLWGWGSPADRAWVFLAILQQMKIEGLICQFPDLTIKAYDHPYLLIAVPLENNIYLFDPFLGLPLPHGLDSTDPQSDWKQATWADFSNTQQFWKQYQSRSLKHPLETPQAENRQFLAFGTSSAWSQRMYEFESLLRGEQVCTLFSPILDVPGQTTLIAEGIQARLKKNLSSTPLPDLNGIWTYPESMINRFDNPTPEQQANIDVRMKPFFTESIIVRESTSQNTDTQGDVHKDLSYTYSQSRQLKYFQARLAQLQQDNNESISSFVKISLKKPDSKSELENYLQFIMAQDAGYWLGLCQYENEEYEVAANSLKRYLDKYGAQGRWFQSALINYAQSLAATGNYDDAIKFAGNATANSPQLMQISYLVNFWKQKAGQLEAPTQPLADPDTSITPAPISTPEQ